MSLTNYECIALTVITTHPIGAPVSHCPRRTQSYLIQARERGSEAPQMLSFRALTQYAFTMVRAGLAFTFCILPKIRLVPAFVAGLVFVLIMTSPGIVNLPFCTSLVATSASASNTFEHSDFL